MGITRQAYYQAEKRAQMTAQATEQILELVMEYRCLMPSIGTRKLYWLIKGKLLQRGLKCGRDQLFKILGGVSKSMLTLNEAIIDVKKG